MKIYSYTAADLTKDMNIGKDVLANTLYDAGVINEAQQKIIREDFALIVAEKNFFGRAIGALLNWTDPDALYFKGIQIRNFNKNNKGNEEDVHQPTKGDQ